MSRRERRCPSCGKTFRRGVRVLVANDDGNGLTPRVVCQGCAASTVRILVEPPVRIEGKTVVHARCGCKHGDCTKEGGFRVHWPGQTIELCPAHASTAANLAGYLGFDLTVDPLPGYRVVDLPSPKEDAS